MEILDRGARSPAVVEIGTLEEDSGLLVTTGSHPVGYHPVIQLFIHSFTHYEPLRARPFDRYPGLQIN